jgi:hypothetical protein
MDATRMSDGQLVMLKKVSRLDYPHKVAIGLYFSCPPLAADPRNHCVPVFDVLQLPEDPNIELIVTPLLRAHNDPPFDTVGEVVECLRQIFEVSSIKSECICFVQLCIGHTVHAS